MTKTLHGNVKDEYEANTTAVDDIDKKEPTNIPSDNFAPHSYIR